MASTARRTGLTLGLAALVLGVLALISTRGGTRSVHSGDATGTDRVPYAAVESPPPADGPSPLRWAETTGDSATLRTRATTATATDPLGDGDATIGPDHECDAAETNAAAAGQRSRIAGAIRGILLSEGGPWTAQTLPKPNMVMLDLVASNSGRENQRGVIEARTNASGTIELVFAFEELPEGEYELTLSALGSWRWSPMALHVRPPLEGITFTRYDKDEKLPLAFGVFDAALGVEITTFQARHIQLTPSRDNGVFLHTGPLDANEFPIDARFAWSLWADGYAPAFGDETAFVRRGDRRVAHVELARGWSTRVLVLARDPAARPVQGAELQVDGRRAGFTGADGTLVVRAAARPAALAVRYAGWKSSANPLAAFEGRTAEQRGQITIVMLDRE